MAPQENFWPATSIEDSESSPSIVVTWGTEHPGVHINGVRFDRSALNRLIRVTRTARDKAYGHDE
jgi:hypothetical protein